jgi:hypothetical protein
MKKLFLTLFALILAGSPLLAENAPVQLIRAQAHTRTVQAKHKKQKKQQRKHRKTSHGKQKSDSRSTAPITA